MEILIVRKRKYNVCEADVGSTGHCLIWTESQQMRVINNRRGVGSCTDGEQVNIEVEEKQREIQEEMTNNAERVSELLESIGTTENDTERDSAGDRITEEWEQLVKNTASKVIEKKLIIRHRTVKYLDEEVKEAIRVRREAYARCTSNKATAGWEEYATVRNEV